MPKFRDKGILRLCKAFLLILQISNAVIVATTKRPTLIFHDSDSFRNGKTSEPVKYQNASLVRRVDPISAPPIPQSLLISPTEAMAVKINNLTHAAFSQTKIFPTRDPRPETSTAKKYISLRRFITTESQQQTESPTTQATHSVTTVPTLSDEIVANKSFPSNETLKLRSPKLQTAESENVGPNFVTADHVSGNRPTLTPFHFTTAAPTPPPSTTIRILANPKSRNLGRNRYKEGKKVTSPHNRIFAPTHNPIHLEHDAEDLAREDFTDFRAALSYFGARHRGPQQQLPQPEPPTTTTTPQPTTTNAVIIHRTKIVSSSGSNYIENNKNRNKYEDGLPFYKESGGLFEPHALRREKDVSNLTPAIIYSSKNPNQSPPTIYKNQNYRSNHNRNVGYVPPVNHRPTLPPPSRNFSPYGPNRHRDQNVGIPPAPPRKPDHPNHRYPQNIDSRRKFEPYNHLNRVPEKPTRVEYQPPRSHYRDPPVRAPRPPPNNRPYNYDSYRYSPQTTTTTTPRTIHFAKPPPSKTDPASDYFYGDPRPPPPRPRTTATPYFERPSSISEDDDEDYDEDEEYEDEEESDENSNEERREPVNNHRNDYHPTGNPQPPRNRNTYSQQLPNGEYPRSPKNDNFPPHQEPSPRFRNPPPSRNNDHHEVPFQNFREPNIRPDDNYFRNFLPSSEFRPSQYEDPLRFNFNRGNFFSSPGRSGEVLNERQQHRRPSNPAGLDPIYTMSIRDYDAELKRRQQARRQGHRRDEQAQGRPHRIEKPVNEVESDPFDEDEFFFDHEGRPESVRNDPIFDKYEGKYDQGDEKYIPREYKGSHDGQRSHGAHEEPNEDEYYNVEEPSIHY